MDGRLVHIPDEDISLLDLLRERAGCRTPKDGCSPQGQCGCCTVWVDGSPRVACVTPARRVAGRDVTTVDGLDPAVATRWADAFASTGASQCGFCTPGIIMRLAALDDRRLADGAAVDRALLAHLCRCTGWRTIREAARSVADSVSGCTPEGGPASPPSRIARPRPHRDLDAAVRRATLEGGTPQQVGPAVALGGGLFADDTAPPGALVAVPDGRGGFAVGESPAAARAAAGKVPGRNSSAALRYPVDVAPGTWDVTLCTTFVEPAYLEPDASWCEPGGEPATALANGGAFGGKVSSPVTEAARRLADRYGRPVRVVFSREDVVRYGPKRPPLAAGVRSDGTGVVRVARTPGSADLGPWVDAVRSVLPAVAVEEHAAAGPPVSCSPRGAGWVEAEVLRAALEATRRGEIGPGLPVTVASPAGALSTAVVGADGAVAVTLSAGEVLDEVVLRSYALGAAHQALGWVRTEGVAVDDGGEVLDLTIRSFGVLSARDTPRVDVVVEDGPGPAVAGSDTVFAAVAAAAWLAAGLPPRWPAEAGGRR